MKVIGKKVKSGKAQHLKVGYTYEVSEAISEALISNGQAELPKKTKPRKKAAKK